MKAKKRMIQAQGHPVMQNLESENFSNLTCGGGGYFSDLYPWQVNIMEAN